MGAYATVFPGGVPITPSSAAELAAHYGFEVPGEPGLAAADMLDAARRGDLDVLYSSGGNFLDVLPDPANVEAALARTPLRVHQDIFVSSQMLVDPGTTVVLLPAATRYEQRGGGTSTTTERRVAFSPEIEGPRVGEARAEWEIFVDLARRVDPVHADALGCQSAEAIRAEIAKVVPSYSGIERLHETGDQVQWGGARLCDGWRFPTPDGRAHFAVTVPPTRDVPDGRFVLSTRRGKQFNSMVWTEKDPLTGAKRDALFLANVDADALRLGPGDPVLVRSAHGEMQARVHLAPIRPGNVQAFFPEANVLLPSGSRDPSGVPDYNTVVDILPLRASSNS
jgi:predicted molibdopterin-dependent oxidoreductase YjgC